MKRYRDTPPKEETGHLCFGHKKAPAGGFSVINDGHHQSYHERITRTSVCIFRRRCHLLWPERESGKTGAFWRDICDQDHSLRFVSVKFKFSFCVSNCLPVEIPERFKVAPPVQLFFLLWWRTNDCSRSIRSTLCLNQMTNQTRKVTNGQSSAQIGHIADDRWIQQKRCSQPANISLFFMRIMNLLLWWQTIISSTIWWQRYDPFDRKAERLGHSQDGDGVDKGNLTGPTRSVKRTILLFSLVCPSCCIKRCVTHQFYGVASFFGHVQPLFWIWQPRLVPFPDT